MKIERKSVFNKNAPKLFSNKFNSPQVTFLIIPILAIFSGLALALTLIITIPGIYTKYEGRLEVRETTILDKKIYGKRNNQYSIKLEGIDKSIDVKRIDFMNMEVGKKITIEGKASKYGLLLEEFNRL